MRRIIPTVAGSLASASPSIIPRGIFLQQSAQFTTTTSPLFNIKDFKKMIQKKNLEKKLEREGIDIDDDFEDSVDPDFKEEFDEEARRKQQEEAEMMKQLKAQQEAEDAAKRQKLKEIRAKQMESRQKERDRLGGSKRNNRFNTQSSRVSIEEIDDTTEKQMEKQGDFKVEVEEESQDQTREESK